MMNSELGIRTTSWPQVSSEARAIASHCQRVQCVDDANLMACLDLGLLHGQRNIPSPSRR